MNNNLKTKPFASKTQIEYWAVLPIIVNGSEADKFYNSVLKNNSKQR